MLVSWFRRSSGNAQLFPDAGQVSIASGRFDHDASAARVTDLADTAFSNAVGALTLDTPMGTIT